MEVTRMVLSDDAVEQLDDLLGDCSTSAELLLIIQYLLGALREDAQITYRDGELAIVD